MKLWTVRSLIALPVVVAACASPPEPIRLPVPDDPLQVSARKQRMLLVTESAIQKIVAQASSDIAAVRANYEREYALLPTVLRLNVVDDVLENYAEEERAAFSASVTELEQRTSEALEQVLADSEARMWDVAKRSGRTERGADLGFISGYRELDDKVNAAVVQLERRANVHGIEQSAIVRRTERVPLQREIREEVEGVGLIQMFISAPAEMHRLAGANEMRTSLVEGRRGSFPVFAETVVGVLTYKRTEGIEARKLRFLQAERQRVERGGLVLTETPWVWTRPDLDGEFPARPQIDHPDYLASETTTPLPNPQVEGFTRLRSHTLVEEYRTGLQDVDTGEIVVCVGWQVVWAVDYRGQLRVLSERAVERLTDGSVLVELLEANTPPEEEPEVEEGELGAPSAP